MLFILIFLYVTVILLPVFNGLKRVNVCYFLTQWHPKWDWRTIQFNPLPDFRIFDPEDLHANAIGMEDFLLSATCTYWNALLSAQKKNVEPSYNTYFNYFFRYDHRHLVPFGHEGYTEERGENEYVVFKSWNIHGSAGKIAVLWGEDALLRRF